MTQREENRREMMDRVRACIAGHLDRGQPFPSVRRICEETGVASVATASKYVHFLQESGEVELPLRYPAPKERTRVLGVRSKRLLLADGGSMTLRIVMERRPNGMVDARVVRVDAGGHALRVVSCTEEGHETGKECAV